MAYYDLASSWKNFRLNEDKKIRGENQEDLLTEKREILSEISKEASEKIQGWFAENADDLSFSDLFKDQLRIVLPLETEDQKKLRSLIISLKDNDWELPQHSGFETKMVRHVDTELGGGERVYEKPIAKLELQRSVTKVIPAGPRKGERITQTKKLSLSKLVAKHSRSGRDQILRVAKLKDWWEKKQQYYTKDDNWKEIEAIFKGEVVRQHIVITRHPMDVLRMSDIDEIESCHSEGQGYFKCAMHEAQGHGPIAYLVDALDLEGYLKRTIKKKEEGDELIYFDDEDYYDYDAADPDYGSVKQQVKKIKKTLLMGTPKTKNTLTIFSRFWADNYKEMSFRGKADLHWASGMDVDVDVLIKVMENYYSSKELHENIPGYDLDENYSEEDLIKMIGKLDAQEIFRDPDRNVKGIGARARVRLRKFEDSANNIDFTVPEKQTYGPHPPGFRKAVLNWAWENQKDLFERENVKDWLPDIQDIIRWGGSYEDTYDGLLLHDFFENSKDFWDLEVDYLSQMNVRRAGQMDRSWELDMLIRQVDEHTHQFNMEHGSSPGQSKPGIWLSANVEDQSEYHGTAADEDEPLRVQIRTNAKMTMRYDLPGIHDKPQSGDEFLDVPDAGHWDSHDFREIVMEAANNLDAPVDNAEWRIATRAGVDKLMITYTLQYSTDDFESGALDNIDSFDDFVNILEQLLEDDGEVYDEFSDHLRKALQQSNVLPRSHFQAFAKSFQNLEDQLENLEIDGITFHEDEFELDDDQIEVYAPIKILFTLPEKVLSLLLQTEQIVKGIFFGADVSKWGGAVEEDQYFYVKVPRSSPWSRMAAIVIRQTIMRDLEKLISKERKNGDSPFEDEKYESQDFYKFLYQLAELKYTFRIGPKSSSSIDMYWEMTFKTNDTKEYLEAALQLIKYLDTRTEKIQKIIAQMVKEKFETYLEDLKKLSKASI